MTQQRANAGPDSEQALERVMEELVKATPRSGAAGRRQRSASALEGPAERVPISIRALTLQP
jgi:hypothetical protein